MTGIAGLEEGDCFLRTVFGLYCPGCGGTRALVYLFTGHPLLSLYYNPFVGYTVFVIAMLFGSYALCRVSGGKIRRIPYRDRYVWIGLAVLLVNWIVKNAVWLIAGIALI